MFGAVLAETSIGHVRVCSPFGFTPKNNGQSACGSLLWEPAARAINDPQRLMALITGNGGSDKVLRLVALRLWHFGAMCNVLRFVFGEHPGADADTHHQGDKP